MDFALFGISGLSYAAEYLRQEGLVPAFVPAEAVGTVIKHSVAISATAGTIASVLFISRLYEANPIDRTKQLLGTFSTLESSANVKVSSSISDYNSLYDKSNASEEERNSVYQNLVDSYYSLATQFCTPHPTST